MNCLFKQKSPFTLQLELETVKTSVVDTGQDNKTSALVLRLQNKECEMIPVQSHQSCFLLKLKFFETAFSCTHPVSSLRLKTAGLWCFLLAGASLDLKMKRKGVIFTCLNDGCSVRVMGVRLNSLLHLLSLVLTVREHVLVWRIHVPFLYLTVIVSVCACDCVGIWMCVWCVHVGIRVGVGFYSIPTLVI